MLVSIIIQTDDPVYTSFPDWLNKLLKIFFQGDLPKVVKVREKILNINAIEEIEQDPETGLTCIIKQNGDSYLSPMTIDEVLHKISNIILYGDENTNPPAREPNQ